MLKPDEAKKQLAQFLLDDEDPFTESQDRFLPQLRKLPAKLQRIGRHLSGLEDDDDEAEQFTSYRTAGIDFDKLSKSDRTKLLKLYFGDFAGYAQLGWDWLKAQGIAGDEDNRWPFRSPGDSDLTAARRTDWLRDMINLSRYLKDGTMSPTWLAAWAPHLDVGWYDFQDPIGILCAAVIDHGTTKESKAVFDILYQSLLKEHETGGMGRHVITGMLCAGREDGWESIEKLLMAAKRQEGLRQSILQIIPDAHPTALRRMLRLIVDEKMARFSSVAQAAGEWFDMQFTSAAAGELHDLISTVAGFLDSPQSCRKALHGKDPESSYLALWAMACHDISQSTAAAKKLLKHKQPEFRYVAAKHLCLLPTDAAVHARVPALYDEDMRVAARAFQHTMYTDPTKSSARCDALEDLLLRMKSKEKLSAIVWPWTTYTLERSQVADELRDAMHPEVGRIAKHFALFDTYSRQSLVDELGELKTWSPEVRDAVLEAIGDRTPAVCKAAVKAMGKHPLKPSDSDRLEDYLTRGTAEMRNGVVQLLLTLSDDHVLASAERLLAASKHQRLGGLELLRKMVESDRSADAVVELAKLWSANRKVLKAEQSQLEVILDSKREVPSLENGLGLFDPAKCSKRVPPKKRKVKSWTATVPRLLKSLDDEIHRHRNTQVTYQSWDGDRTEPLHEVGYRFPSPVTDKPIKPQIVKLPLADAWTNWYDKRPASLRDSDGLELVRALLYHGGDDVREELQFVTKKYRDFKPLADAVGSTVRAPRLRYDDLISELLMWLICLNRPKNLARSLVDSWETMLALVPQSAHERLPSLVGSDDEDAWDEPPKDWRTLEIFDEAFRAINRFDCTLLKADSVRVWKLLHWRDEPATGARRRRPDADSLAEAWRLKAVNIHDIADSLLGPHQPDFDGDADFDTIQSLTPHRVPKGLQSFVSDQKVSQLLEDVRERLLEVEIQRGEAATLSSDAALAVQSWYGADTLLTLLRMLGRTGFKRHRDWSRKARDSRQVTFTEIVSKLYPSETDTAAAFRKSAAAAIKANEFPEERLLQLAFFAPQWIDFIEAAVGWKGFREGIYWHMAHLGHIWEINDAFSDLDHEDDADEDGDAGEDGKVPDRLTPFERLIRERTTLTTAERFEGAIDVGWFHRTHKLLGAKRFDALTGAAKFAATPQAAKKAQFVADVLLGKVNKTELVTGIRKKHLKDYVRLLGLLPLTKGKQRDADLLDRYEVLQEYRRYASKLSSMTRPEALRACDTGMQNLAATAGFPDSMRLQWAMEAESTKDLSSGALTVSSGDVSMTLELDDTATPSLTIRRGDKELRNLPAKTKKNAKFTELRERSKHIKRQSSRMRQALEQSMLRADAFSGAELMQLSDHSILWPQLSRLVLIGDDIAGYPVKRGKGLVDHSGTVEPVRKSDSLRIAHPVDLFRKKAWSKWQKECFASERLQPFKQVFRELYVITAQEKKDRVFSARYAGHQVNPRQAMTLFGRRDWSVDEYGEIFKAIPAQNLIVRVTINRGYTTPLEVEGLTIENVAFTTRDDYKPLPLKKVPPLIFSEVMRDIDLVVSVAHAGDVDPEASASTTELRAALLSETCRLLGIKNVRIAKDRAMIKGSLGEYTVHLGSGVVHKQPGGAVCLVPIHSQHRGRLFLPFADDDPRTAEVISKTLLLARDEDIDDPILLDQIRA